MTITNAMLFELGARLLDIAADEFGNHGCNDFKLQDWSAADRKQLAIEYEIYNGDDREVKRLRSLPLDSPYFDYFAEFCLMNYVGHRLEEMAKEHKP